MARVPEAELARLKREVDLVGLVAAAGVVLKRHGADLIGRCPFHDDQSPSLVVTPAKNLWHCLGACQAGGSVIDWVMRAERVSFRHAVELLQKREPIVSSVPRAVSTTNVLAPLVDRDADDDALARSVVDYYHQTLLESPEAIRYLESRGLNDRALMERFRLGFANRTLGYRLPKTVLKAGAEVRGRLQRLGFLRASGHEHLTGSIVVPIVGERGRIAQCYGRKITPNLRAGTPVHCYLPGPHTAVWNVDALADAKEILLCEALLDALTCWRAGLTHVITSYGVSGFTEAHRAALRHHGTERVLIAYDADEAGDRAAERVAGELHAMGIGAYRVNFPRGFDVNAYALAHAPAAESLAALVQGATWLGRAAPLVSVPADITNAPTDEPSPASSLAAAVATGHPTDAVSLTIEHHGDDIHARRGDVTYRVRGLAKNQTADTLRVNLCAARGPERHVDTLDLYGAKARAGFIAQAAAELGLGTDQVKQDVGCRSVGFARAAASPREGIDYGYGTHGTAVASPAIPSTSRYEMSSYKPAQYTSVAPYLIVDGAADTIEFLRQVFDATELRRFADESGRVIHAEVRIDDTVVMLADAAPPDWPATPSSVHVYVANVDETYQRALAAGAASVQEPVKKQDEDRRGGVKDAGGTTWWIATKVV